MVSNYAANQMMDACSFWHGEANASFGALDTLTQRDTCLRAGVFSN
jgi:hypothetical protein